jgi:hypothetical protein
MEVLVKGYLIFEFVCVVVFAVWWITATIYAVSKKNPLPHGFARWTLMITFALCLSGMLVYGAFQLESKDSTSITLLEKE